MKLILLSDIHLLAKNPISRIDDLTETQLVKLEYVLDYAEREKAVILQAGDFFDKPRSWNLLPVVAGLLWKYRTVKIKGVFGQHDTYMYSEDTRERTNLGILERAGLIGILGAKPSISLLVEGIQVYGASFGQEPPIPKDIDALNILVIHADICDRPLFPNQDYKDSKKYLKDHPEYDLILCGDNHVFFMVEDGKRLLVNVGPMLRKEATEYNMTHKPGFALYDTEKREAEWIEIPHEPAEYVLDRDRLEREDETASLLDDFVESIQGGEYGDEVSFREILEMFLIENQIDKRVKGRLSGIMMEGEE